MKRLASIDIGSTYTKGAVFALENDGLSLLGKAVVPTTPECLPDGYNSLLAALDEYGPIDQTYFSSSAKGGLKIAAIGIVPDLTLEMARLTALSAGARITDVYSYKLTPEDIVELRLKAPDIILFTGGTDGGAEDFNRHNAKLLAAAELPTTIVYAGNRAIAAEIAEIIQGTEFVIVDNVLPDLETPNPEPARNTIRKIFLDKIVHGKGLDDVAKQTQCAPRPTPLAMFELVKTIHQQRPEADDFCVIDMGGATTDFYSCGNGRVESNVVIKGVKPPTIMRTVEGDLGLRVSSLSVYDSMREFIENNLAVLQITGKALESYLAKVDGNHSHLPASDQEKQLDRLLAQACCYAAAKRHAGYRKQVYTMDGEAWIQRGKDLRHVEFVVGTGGYLSRATDFDLLTAIRQGAVEEDTIALLPTSPRYLIDTDYLLPLLANIAFDYPTAAVNLAMQSMTEFNPEDCGHACA